jgi:hypothetical protein
MTFPDCHLLVAAHTVKSSIAEDMGGVTTVRHGVVQHGTAHHSTTKHDTACQGRAKAYLQDQAVAAVQAMQDIMDHSPGGRYGQAHYKKA